MDPSDSDAHDTAPHDTDAHPESGEEPDSPASDDSAAPDTGKDASTCGCATPQAPLTALLALIVSRRRSGRRAGSGSA